MLSTISDRLWFTSSGGPCHLCHRPRHRQQRSLFCSHCIEQLPLQQNNCFQCAIPLPHNDDNKKILCGDCLKQKPLQQRSISPFLYRFPLPELIGEIKFTRQVLRARALSHYFAEYCTQSYCGDTMPEYILPVPLHPQREFQRGFNQSQLLSELIAKALKIPCQSDWVLRRQNTPSQMQLNIKDRKKNMKDAFQAGPGIQVSRHIALFDDVMTTGATLSSIATVLKRAGAKRVDFWSLARTPK